MLTRLKLMYAYPTLVELRLGYYSFLQNFVRFDAWHELRAVKKRYYCEQSSETETSTQDRSFNANADYMSALKLAFDKSCEANDRKVYMFVLFTHIVG